MLLACLQVMYGRYQAAWLLCSYRGVLLVDRIEHSEHMLQLAATAAAHGAASIDHSTADTANTSDSYSGNSNSVRARAGRTPAWLAAALKHGGKSPFELPIDFWAAPEGPALSIASNRPQSSEQQANAAAEATSQGGRRSTLPPI